MKKNTINITFEEAYRKMEENMEWGTQRIKEFHADIESVIDQTYGYNMGIINLMPEEFYGSIEQKFTAKWDKWLSEVRSLAV